LYAAFFTEILADSGLFTLHLHPFVRGNQKGVGKDLLAYLLGIIRDGDTPVDLHHDEPKRFNQAFGNGVMEGRRIFKLSNIADNVEFNCPMFTRWATDERLEVARHGVKGNWVLDPNNVTVLLNTNRAQINYDLADRLLPIDLVVTGNATSRPFTFKPKKYVQENLYNIAGEVLGLALGSFNDGHSVQLPEKANLRFSEWANTIAPMLKRRGLGDFLLPDELDQSVSCGAQYARQQLLQRMHEKFGGKKVHAKDVLELCRTDGALLFPEHVSAGQPAKQLAKYELEPMVNSPVSLERLGLDLTLRKCEDRARKTSWYWVVARPLVTIEVARTATAAEPSTAQCVVEAAAPTEYGQ